MSFQLKRISLFRVDFDHKKISARLHTATLHKKHKRAALNNQKKYASSVNRPRFSILMKGAKLLQSQECAFKKSTFGFHAYFKLCIYFSFAINRRLLQDWNQFINETHENVFQYLKDPTDASLSCLKGSDVREDVLRKGLSHKPNQ